MNYELINSLLLKCFQWDTELFFFSFFFYKEMEICKYKNEKNVLIHRCEHNSAGEDEEEAGMNC